MEIRQLQRSLLQLLDKFNDITQRNGINYSLHGGTLLGAIREKGFIPWDDDVDIAMTREDYNKLRKYIDTDESRYYLRGNIKVQFCDKENANLWIDIFICDYISDNSQWRKVKLTLLTILDVMLRDKESMKYSDLDKYSKLKQLSYKLIYYIGKIFPASLKQRVYLYISKKLLTGDKRSYFRSNDQYIARKMIMPIEWMSKFIAVPFENGNYMVSKHYNELLTLSYGSNFMTPIKDTRNSVIHEQIRNTEGGFKL